MFDFLWIRGTRFRGQLALARTRGRGAEGHYPKGLLCQHVAVIGMLSPCWLGVPVAKHIVFEVGERFALTEVFVIGASAILAVLPDPPEGVLTTTRDVDIIPPNDKDECMADQHR
jgi:hypothetical protein